MQETWVQSLGWEDSLEKEMATHSSILAWEVSWTEETSILPGLFIWIPKSTSSCFRLSILTGFSLSVSLSGSSSELGSLSAVLPSVRSSVICLLCWPQPFSELSTLNIIKIPKSIQVAPYFSPEAKTQISNFLPDNSIETSNKHLKNNTTEIEA